MKQFDPSVGDSLSPPVPPALADLALVSGPQLAAAAGMHYRSFLLLLQRGHVPEPEIRLKRFSRWTLPTARRWLSQIAEAGRLEIGDQAGASATTATTAAPVRPARASRVSASRSA